MLNVDPNEEDSQDNGFDAAAAEADLRERLRLEPLALEEEFIRCPADIAYMGAIHARAIGVQLRAKSAAKRVRGIVFMQCRQKLIKECGKATEEMIKAEVEQDLRVQAADSDEITAEVGLAQAKANFTAIVAKKDMLVQMGATARAEMERDPMIARERRGARDVRGG